MIYDNKIQIARTFREKLKNTQVNYNYHNYLFNDIKSLKNDMKISLIKVKKLYSKLQEIEFLHNNVKNNSYLIHPLRVARLAVKYYNLSDTELIKLALTHNIIEVTEFPLKFLRNLLGQKTLSYINLLTVNRSLQWDWGYKEDYYSKISKERSVAVIKILDKYDNLFLLYNNQNLEIKKKYIYEIERYVLPLVKNNLPNLEFKFYKLINENKNYLNN